MRLDYDCVRNILLTIESLGYDDELTNQNINEFPKLREYHPQKITYTILRLVEANFVVAEAVHRTVGGAVFSLQEMTWEGHQFLDYIRDNDVWIKTKKQVPSTMDSLPAKFLIAIATKIIEHTID